MKLLEDANKLEDGLASRHKSPDMVAWQCSNFISFHLTSVEIKEIFWSNQVVDVNFYSSLCHVTWLSFWCWCRSNMAAGLAARQEVTRWHVFSPPEVIVHRQRCRALQALGLISPGGQGQSWRVEKFSHRGGGEGERGSHAKIWHEDRRRACLGLSRAKVTGGGANVFTETFCVSSADGGCFLFVC